MQTLNNLDPRIFQWLSAYGEGYFPMADDHGELHWYSAHAPAIVPLDQRFHIPKSMRRILNARSFRPMLNRNFEAVLQGCAHRKECWISEELKEIYRILHLAGYAHSFECYDSQGQLAGGVLGLTLGAAFIGETMFTAIPNGGKAALIYLVQSLRLGDFVHFDCQLLNDNTARFGAYEITPEQHHHQLQNALSLSADLRMGLSRLLQEQGSHESTRS